MSQLDIFSDGFPRKSKIEIRSGDPVLLQPRQTKEPKDPARHLGIGPVPTDYQPEIGDLIEWESEGYSVATDGCEVEPDGWCEHGHPSWLLSLGLI